jgi:hypothetical protein
VRISTILLAVAITTGFGAWSIQSSASSAMETTLRLQTTDVPEPDAAPPSLDQNRRILEVLGASIDIREDIDALLADVEASVAGLRQRQAGALALANRGRDELEAIGRSLGGAVDAGGASVERLRALRSRLTTSLALARRIARELAELDAKLGPGAGGEQ